jgi:hypothetical protein
LGVWEDAQRQAAAQRLAEVQARQCEQTVRQEQTRGVAKFIEGMRRLGIQPRREPFLKFRSPMSKAAGYYPSRRHKVLGWAIGADAVITPDGSVYDLKDSDRKPRDLRRRQQFWITNDWPESLTDLLKAALIKAMSDD